jgi:endonuclease/exonuclease/phosphatase (EEP) superfamily protein YafD
VAASDTTEPQRKSARKVRRRVGGLLLAASDIYAIPTALFVALRVLTGYLLWPIAFASNTLPWPLLLSIPLLAALLALRRWKRAVLAAIPVAAFLGWYGLLLIPKPPAECTAPCEEIHLLQYNIGPGLLAGEDLIRVVRESGADIITLQEVESAQAEQLRSGVADMYPFQIYELAGGAGLLSRYPIQDYEPLRLEGRSYLRADLDVNGRTLLVISAHPYVGYMDLQNWKYSSRSISALEAMAELASQGMPTIIAGDFNMVDQSSDYDLLIEAGLHDAFRERGWGFGLTYPTSMREHRSQ